MNERKEPTISSSNVPLEKDERARAQAGAAGRSGTRGDGGPPRPGPPPVSSRPVVVRSPLAPLALVVALAAAGLSGYLFWQLQQTQQRIAAADQSVAQTASQAESRIAELERRLMLSDDESSASLTVLQSNVKENASEIRKLWGVAYDRNRPAIAKLEESVASLNKTLNGVDSKIQSAVGDVAGEVRVLSELVDAQQAVINRADKSVKEQAAAINSAVQKLENVDGPLRKQVEANAEAIEAIDAFRLQVNRELLQLRGG